ncbi:MFS transporter [Undibacterium sp.]|uniref:MFS transporter n=1 Tax=Undibacterium sp. TaxID=1914977 RepID=UPI00374DBA57
MNAYSQPSPWSDLLSPRNVLRSIALTGGVALHAINVHIVTTILPSVVRDIGGLQYYAWNTTLFVVASILGASLTARMLAMFAPGKAYFAALGLFSAGAIVCATAPTMAWMLAGRGIQGLGGGMLATLSYALIRVIFEERLWARAIALVSGMWGVATLFGPAVGGLFAQSGNWRMAFWALLPIALLLALTVSTQLKASSPISTNNGPTPWGRILLLAASALAVAAASLAEQNIWKAVIALCGIGLGMLFVRRDSRAEVRLLPAGSYKTDKELGSIFAAISLLTIATTTEIFVPYFLQLIHRHTPLGAGYMTAAMAAGWSIASVAGSGKTEAKARRMVTTGPIVMSVSLAALAFLLPEAARFPALIESVLIGAALFGAGLGVGIGWPHLLTRVLKITPAGEEGLTSGAITIVQLYAMAIGAAMAGLLVNAAGLSVPGGIEGAQQAAFWLFAVFTLAPLLAAVLLRKFAAAETGH